MTLKAFVTILLYVGPLHLANLSDGSWLYQYPGYPAHGSVYLFCLLVSPEMSPALCLSHCTRYLILNFGNIANLDINMWCVGVSFLVSPLIRCLGQ